MNWKLKNIKAQFSLLPLQSANANRHNQVTKIKHQIFLILYTAIEVHKSNEGEKKTSIHYKENANYFTTKVDSLRIEKSELTN